MIDVPDGAGVPRYCRAERQRADPVQSLPAYPYPLMATYNGTGNVDLASSYHAALPAQPFDAHIDWLGSFSPSDTAP
jgi:hypothetical protein